MDSDIGSPSNVSGDEKEAGAWYHDPLYRRYWKHYERAAAWYTYHCHLVTSAPRQRLRLFNAWPPSHSHSTVPFSSMSGDQNSHHGSSIPTTQTLTHDLASPNEDCIKYRSTRSRNASKKKHRRRRKMKVKPEDEEATDDLEFEMEITPEMREFFITSAKHKQEREAQQKEEAENGDYIDLTEVTMHTKRVTGTAPTEQPGRRRTNQMKLLYGPGAAMIHGMETALQLNFDRNYDIKTPKLWPHLPLNITFHS